MVSASCKMAVQGTVAAPMELWEALVGEKLLSLGDAGSALDSS